MCIWYKMHFNEKKYLYISTYTGEAVIITKTAITKRQLISPEKIAPCIFEYVYFARPDSVIDGISVYRSRLEMGEHLADQVVKKCGDKLDIDVVIPVYPLSIISSLSLSLSMYSCAFSPYSRSTPTYNQVPDTSRVAALQVSYKLKIAYREGFIKNRYVGRTFIMPGQQTRRKNVRRKLNAMALEFANKNVLIVDGIYLLLPLLWWLLLPLLFFLLILYLLLLLLCFFLST